MNYWPATRPTDHSFAAEAMLREAGVSRYMQAPADWAWLETVLVLLANAAMGPMFGVLFSDSANRHGLAYVPS